MCQGSMDSFGVLALKALRAQVNEWVTKFH